MRFQLSCPPKHKYQAIFRCWTKIISQPRWANSENPVMSISLAKSVAANGNDDIPPLLPAMVFLHVPAWTLQRPTTTQPGDNLAATEMVQCRYRYILIRPAVNRIYTLCCTKIQCPGPILPFYSVSFSVRFIWMFCVANDILCLCTF